MRNQVLNEHLRLIALLHLLGASGLDRLAAEKNTLTSAIYYRYGTVLVVPAVELSTRAVQALVPLHLAHLATAVVREFYDFHWSSLKIPKISSIRDRSSLLLFSGLLLASLR